MWTNGWIRRQTGEFYANIHLPIRDLALWLKWACIVTKLMMMLSSCDYVEIGFLSFSTGLMGKWVVAVFLLTLQTICLSTPLLVFAGFFPPLSFYCLFVFCIVVCQPSLWDLYNSSGTSQCESQQHLFRHHFCFQTLQRAIPFLSQSNILATLNVSLTAGIIYVQF